MKEKPDEATKEKWFNDPSNWKAVIFYYNRADKRIFPPKKFGGGWTINFANWKSIIFTIITAGVSVTILIFLIKRFG